MRDNLNAPAADCCATSAALRESAVALSVAYHLLAVRIERVVDDPLCCIQCVVILEPEMAKALGNGIETGTFGLVIERVVGVGAIDDLPEQHQRRIAR